MTGQEKLKKMESILQDYVGHEGIFAAPAVETDKQKQFRETLHMVVSILFKEDLTLPSDLSVKQMKKRIRKIWKETKPEGWK